MLLHELSGANCYAKLSHSKQLPKNIHPVMLAHFVHWRKSYLQCSHWKPRGITNRTQLQQQRRKTSRQNACAYDQRSDSHWWHQSASHKWLRKQQFDHGVNVIEGCYHVWCCYNGSCPPYVRSEASSLSFSRTVPGVYDAWGNQLSLQTTSSDIEWF